MVITPAAGVVKPVGALALGALSSIFCYQALNLKNRLGYDDSLDCFGIHGVGSGLGVLLLCFFIRDCWMADAAAAAGGWSAWHQLGIQALGMGATVALAAAGTLAVCIVIEKTVGFRMDPEGELAGMDYSLHGETGYGLVSS